GKCCAGHHLGPVAPLFPEGRERIPDQQKYSGHGGFCETGSSEGPAVFKIGPDQLPQCDDLHVAGPAKEDPSALSLCSQCGWNLVPGFFRNCWRFRRSVCSPGQEAQNLYEEDGAIPSPVRFHAALQRRAGSSARHRSTETAGSAESRAADALEPLFSA